MCDKAGCLHRIDQQLYLAQLKPSFSKEIAATRSRYNIVPCLAQTVDIAINRLSLGGNTQIRKTTKNIRRFYRIFLVGFAFKYLQKIEQF